MSLGNSNKKIAVLILAAGESTRMGQIKQLLPWGTTTLLGNAIHNANASMACEVFVVLGAKAQKIKEEVAVEGVVFVENQDWRSGMGTSIVCGIRSLTKQQKTYDGALIMLCDQPLINTLYLNALIDTFIHKEKGIVATRYRNSEGVPAIFGQSYFPELMELNKDYGAKDILKQHKDDVFSLGSHGKAMDIDTMDDYNRLIRMDPKEKPKS